MMNSTKKCTGWLAGLLFGGLAAMSAAGCATPSAPATSSDEAELGVCCEGGTVTCPTNPAIEIDYSVPGCLPLNHLQALSHCKQSCHQTCDDTGWINFCE